MARFTRRRIGELLIDSKAITREQLFEALEEQKANYRPTGQILISKGFITEEKLAQTLEEQLGILQVNLYNYNIDPEVATSIPTHMAQRYQVIPIHRQGKKVILAMADPMNIIALDDVAMYTGAEVEPVIALPSAVEHAINQFFGLKESLELTADENKTREDEEELSRLKTLVEDAPIVKVVNSLIHQAVNEGASDIHIEPSGSGVRIRMRIDGILHDLMSPPKDTQPLIVSRIKIMSNLDIAERRLPQDGRILLQSGLKDVNLRVSTMPTIHGEKVVIRILEKERVVLPLEKLGMSEHNFRVFKQTLLSQSGMILVTGPTGCGKTTTLYSVLNYLNCPEDNIITVEDPVEYRLEGINQIQVNPKINLTFANALRAILRQDPNIIMVGEIRDLETAEIATRAALTGHLVLSTLHTNDAPRAISRLQDMGVESYLITSSLLAVVAQRLIRL
ncbi:MAG TPA: Flp pilus assembly complex ATPase component TadA, partial [Firmicutes bacterium]|nr:Flp pilus assembly complex ATPase component TadA [Bacillota bacterium]